MIGYFDDDELEEQEEDDDYLTLAKRSTTLSVCCEVAVFHCEMLTETKTTSFDAGNSSTRWETLIAGAFD